MALCPILIICWVSRKSRSVSFRATKCASSARPIHRKTQDKTQERYVSMLSNYEGPQGCKKRETIAVKPENDKTLKVVEGETPLAGLERVPSNFSHVPLTDHHGGTQGKAKNPQYKSLKIRNLDSYKVASPVMSGSVEEVGQLPQQLRRGNSFSTMGSLADALPDLETTGEVTEKREKQRNVSWDVSEVLLKSEDDRDSLKGLFSSAQNAEKREKSNPSAMELFATLVGVALIPILCIVSIPLLCSLPIILLVMVPILAVLPFILLLCFPVLVGQA